MDEPANRGGRDSTGEQPTLAGLDTRLWPPTALRPPDYPAALPFLPDTMAQTAVEAGERGTAMAQWWIVTDPAAAVARLVADSVADGWRETARSAALGEVRQERRQFARGTERRAIALVRTPERTGLLLFQVRRTTP